MENHPTSYFLPVDPIPEILSVVQSSSSVIPYDINIPCKTRSPASITTSLSVKFLNLNESADVKTL